VPQESILDVLDAVEVEGGAADDPVGGSILSVLDDVESDKRSRFARAYDVINKPLLPVARGAQWLSDQITKPTRAQAWLAEKAPRTAKALGMVRGGYAGAIEGLGQVLEGFSSPFGAATTAAGLGGARAAASGLPTLARTLGAVDAVGGATVGARGLEQVADAESIPEAGMGLLMTAGGALGVKSGSGFLRTKAPTPPPPAMKGFLPAGPRFVAGESGPAAPFGTEIPMQPAPDGSFVRSVPGEYARREVKGLLPPGPRFVAGETGIVAPLGTEIPLGRAPDGSYVRSVPAEYARREVRGLLPAGPDFIAGERGPAMTLQQMAARSGDSILSVLDDVERASSPDPSGGRTVRAAVLDREYIDTVSPKGRRSQKLVPRQFASDPNAVDAPMVNLTGDEVRELRRMAAEMDALPYVGRTWTEAPKKSGNAAGGDFNIVAGSAGARVYGDIVGESSGSSRADVQQAIHNLLRGKLTPTGDRALDVARRRLTGELKGELPPSAGDFYRMPGEAAPEPTPTTTPSSTKVARFAESDEGGDQLDTLMTVLHGSDWERKQINPRGHGTYDFDQFAASVDDVARGGPDTPTGSREPGEEGFIRPELAARVSLGGVGAAYGAATGEDTQDRIKRAAIFGAAGALGPSLLTRTGGAASRLTGATPPRGQGRLITRAPGPIPRSGQIPADRLHTMPVLTDDVQEAAEAILERRGGFVRQRRGVQSVARTEALADRVEVRTDRPVTPGTAANAEKLRAYQNATATLLKKQKDLEQLVSDGRATPAQQLELETVKSEAEVLTQSLRGMTAEAGRALHILRYQARILELGDPDAIRDAVLASRQGPGGMAQSVFYANILSGVKTHERNILGNLSNAVFNLAAHPFAVGADVVRAAATGQSRQVYLGELPEKVAGTVIGLPRAFSNFLRVIKTGIGSSDVQTFDRPQIREFKGGGANPFNWPKRALESVDDFFSTIAAEQTKYGAAFAQAKREGLTGKALLDRVADLKVNPTVEILEEVTTNRARLLFREKPGQIAQAVLAAKRHVPALGYVLPFVRVPANIIRQGFEASPAGFAMSSARQGGRAGADAMGRAAFGTAALAPLAYYAALGKITGDAPADPAERAAFYESGKRPHSILIGDTWYNYQTVQPLNVPLAVIANGFEAWRTASGDADAVAEEVALAVVGRTASSLLDQSFLSGLSALVDALGDPQRYGEAFLRQLATGFVPFSGALRTATQATDPVVRAPGSILHGVQAIVPGQSSKLPPRLTRFGEPVTRVEGALNVFAPSPVVDDPVAAELQRLGINLRPAQGAKELSIGEGVEVPLSPDLQLSTGQASGRVLRQALEQTMRTPQYQTANPFVQKELLERAISGARRAVNQSAVRAALLERLRAAP
jgi:hypothetical protein